MKIAPSVPVLCCMLVSSAAAEAQTAPAPSLADKYHITEAERAACGSDAVLLCSTSYPDEDRLLACMRANRKQLSSICSPVFEAGMRRRHIPL